MMKEKLVKRSQPFGEVHMHKPSGGEGAPPAMHSKPLGGVTMRPCNGLDHPASFQDKNPGAMNQANKFRDNPFAWTGHPEHKVHVTGQQNVYDLEPGE